MGREVGLCDSASGDPACGDLAGRRSLTKLHSYRKILMPMKRLRSPKYRELLEVLAEEQDQEFQRVLKESAAQIKRGEVSSVAALRAIYRGR